MSEHTHKNTPPPVIKRNDVELTMTEQAFGNKSQENKGKKFFAPIGKLENWEGFTKWVGLDQIMVIVNRSLRRDAADIYLEVAKTPKEDGTFDWELWSGRIADFTAGRTTLSDLEEQIDDLQALQQSYTIDNPDFGQEDANGELTEAAKDLMAKVRDGNAKIKTLRTQRAAIEARYESIAAAREAKKIKSSTKTDEVMA